MLGAAFGSRKQLGPLIRVMGGSSSVGVNKILVCVQHVHRYRYVVRIDDFEVACETNKYFRKSEENFHQITQLFYLERTNQEPTRLDIQVGNLSLQEN